MKYLLRCAMGGVLAITLLVSGHAAAQCAATPYPNGTTKDFDFLLATMDDLLGLVLLDTSTNVNLWTGIDNDTGLAAVPAVTPIWTKIPGQTGPTFVDVDNDGNGINEDDQLDMLDAILDGPTTMSGLNAATVTQIRSNYTANRNLVRLQEATVYDVHIHAVTIITIDDTINVTTGSQACIDAGIAGNQCFDVPSLWTQGTEEGLLAQADPMLEVYLMDLGAAVMTIGDPSMITWFQNVLGQLTIAFVNNLVPQLLAGIKAVEPPTGDDKFTCGAIADIHVDISGLDIAGFTLSNGSYVHVDGVRTDADPQHDICESVTDFVNKFNCTTFACNNAALGSSGNLNGSGSTNIAAYNAASKNRQTWETAKGIANLPLQIVSPPANASFLAGDAVTWAPTIAGTPSGYSWAPTTGASTWTIGTQAFTTPTISLPYALPQQSGQYGLVVCNSQWVRRSEPRTLAIGARAFAFTQNSTPANVTLLVGGNTQFTVQVTGGYAIPTFQWRKGTTNIPGATTNVLTLSNVQTTDSGVYNCQVFGQDPQGTPKTLTSNNSVLTVLQPLIIGTQPTGANLALGGSHTMTVGGVTGGTGNPLTYQWQKNSVNIPGATGTSYALSNVQFTDQASYRVIVTDPTVGFVQSVSSNAVSVTVLGIGTAYDLPSNQSKLTGSSFNLSVRPVGGAVASPGTDAVPPNPAQYTYVWEFDDIPFNDVWVTLPSTTNVLSLSSLTTGNSGKYHVRVKDTANVEVFSNNCVLSVTSTPIVIGTQPIGAGRVAGTNIAFDVTATGGGPTPNNLTFTWYYNGIVLPMGAGVSVNNTGTSSTLNMTNISLIRQGTYFCRVTDGQGQTVDSNTVSLFVGPPLVISTQPVGDKLYAGSNLTLSLVATGGVGPLTYQWFQGTVPVGSNSAALDLSPLTPLYAGTYKCTIHDTGIGDGDPSGYVPNVVTSNNVVVQVAAPLQILAAGQPTGGLVTPGSNKTFTVTATGGFTPLQYQWYTTAKALIPGATTSSYTLNSVTPANDGGYYCIVTDNIVHTPYAVQSATAYILVSEPEPPLVLDDPADLTAQVGTSGFLSVSASGGPTGGYTYQWRKDGTDIPGATSPALVFNNLALTDAGSYDVIVTDNNLVETSAPATLVVTEEPTTPPVPVTTMWGLAGLAVALGALGARRRR